MTHFQLNKVLKKKMLRRRLFLLTFPFSILAFVAVALSLRADRVFAQTATPANFKVAFIADSGQGSSFQNVLNLIKAEGADMVVHEGDFSYDGTSTWINRIDSTLGSNFPYLGSIGNHDSGNWGDIRSGCTNSTFAGYFKCKLQKMGVTPKLSSNRELYAATYKGLKVVFVNLSGGSTGANWVNQQLSGDPNIWKICSWHKNQKAMQVGGKGDSMGWEVYESCRKQGAIIATGHEHTYERTKTLTSTQNQTVDSSCSDRNNLCVAPGKTFVFVSGLGGASIRNQDRCLPTKYPYGCKGEWASIYTSDQGAKHGALFIEFNIGGNPNRAHGYFKNVNGQVIDDFFITKGGSAPPPPPSTPTPIKTPTPTPTGPTPTPPPIPGNAFRGQYYDNQDFTALTHTRIDPAINFDWGLGSPAPSVGVDSFSVRWEGDWNFAQAGTYRFTAETDDGMRVWVDGQQVIDAWKNQSVTAYTGDRQLSSGTHRVKVDYYEAHSPAVARLSWALASSAPIPPPSSGDIDGDGDVDIFDYNILVGNFGSTNCGNVADIDGDCDVDIFDYNILVGNFGKKSGTPTPTTKPPTAVPTPKPTPIPTSTPTPIIKPPGQPISCLNRSGPVITKSGSQSSWDTRGSGLAKDTKIDARTASWVGVSDYPIFLTGGPNVCFAGGLIQGNYPERVGDPATTWLSTGGTAGLTIEIPNFTLEGTRIHNYGDTIRFKTGADNFTVKGVHFTFIRDDCIENDFLHNGLFDDSLLDGCYMGFSSRGSGDGSNKIWTIQNTLVRMQPMWGVYKNRGLIPGHGGFFKWDTNGVNLILKNNVFRADQQSSGGGLGLPSGKVLECSNNVLVWLGSGSPQPGSGQVPLTTSIGGKPCFTITKDISVWDNAVAEWKSRH